MVQHTAIVKMAEQQKVLYDLSNGTIFNDLERLLHPSSQENLTLTLGLAIIVCGVHIST